MREVLGAVAIGRNEGERLQACLHSVCAQVDHVVYVDSGSTDNSLAVARAFGIDIVELGADRPFTAARARNEGFRHLVEHREILKFVQFVDGDCELESAWVQKAFEFMSREPHIAATCGRLTERHPDASVYNRLCQMEWDQPAGEVSSCGGIAMMRVDAFSDAGGFLADLIAGEEPDLCFRLRKLGWRIVRLPVDMALHDAAMLRFSQWWSRSKRSGFAQFEACLRRGKDEPELQRRVLINSLWALPIAWPLWPILWTRIYRKRGALYATHIVLGKLPHLLGTLSYLLLKLRRKQPTLIEHK